MSSTSIDIGLDPAQFDAELDRIDKKIVQTSQKITNIARRGFDTIIILSTVAGKAIDQSYQLMAQAAFVAAETVLQIAAASSITVVGAINAALGIAAAGALFIQATRIGEQNAKAQQETQAIITVANMWRFRG